VAVAGVVSCGFRQPIDIDDLRDLFKWSSPDNPSHMWTPVYLFDLPDIAAPTEMEKPWLYADYPREIGQPVAYSLDSGTSPLTPLITPTYLFTGRYIVDKLFGTLTNNDLVSIVAPRWPIRTRASIVAVPQDPLSPADRAVMYISRHNSVDMGDANRAEALFVWDRESGIENGTYVAYVGTFLPGLTRKVEDAQIAIEADYAASGESAADSIPLPHAKFDGSNWMPTNQRTLRLFELDPERERDAGLPRFETQIAMEFITDRRYAEQMQPPPQPWGPGKTDQPGMLHPREWYPESYTVPKYTAGSDGYILYSKDPNIQWQPIPVRVTDNYLALRVRNMGDASRIACISHVVLAPAPRNRGQINVNTAETHRIVKGATSTTDWTIELFNALGGLPGIVNALNPTMNPDMQPKPDNPLDVPSVVYSKDPVDPNYVADPWRAPWPSPVDMTGGALPPAVPNALKYALIASGTAPDNGDYDEAEEGTAMLRLAALIAAHRTVHPDGRYYNSLAELLAGVYVGGVHKLDRDGTWPLSNLGRPPSVPVDPVNDVANPTEARFEEIVERFGRMSNLTTTRSDVFEIIATVQSGSVVDNNTDGVFDYRGDEFFPTNETRARIIYDRRAQTIKIDEAREVGQDN
jgi:hypothetical protein